MDSITLKSAVDKLTKDEKAKAFRHFTKEVIHNYGIQNMRINEETPYILDAGNYSIVFEWGNITIYNVDTKQCCDLSCPEKLNNIFYKVEEKENDKQDVSFRKNQIWQ